MSVSTQHIDAIDRLLSGLLSESEEKALREEIAQSPELQAELKLQQQLREEFEELGKQALKKQLHRKHQRYVWFALLWEWKWLIGVMTLVGISFSLISLWSHYTRTNCPGEDPIIQTDIHKPAMDSTQADTSVFVEVIPEVQYTEIDIAPHSVHSTAAPRVIPHITIETEDIEQLYFKEGTLTFTGLSQLPAGFKLIYIKPFYYVYRDFNYYQLDNGKLNRVSDVRVLQLLRYVKKSDKIVACHLVQHRFDQRDTSLFIKAGLRDLINGDTLTLDKNQDNTVMEWVTLNGKPHFSRNRKLFFISGDSLLPSKKSYPKASNNTTIPLYVYDLEKAQYVNEE